MLIATSQYSLHNDNLFAVILGNQPKDGRMKHNTKRSLRLPGYESYGAIIIEYDFDSGIQTVSKIITHESLV